MSSTSEDLARSLTSAGCYCPGCPAARHGLLMQLAGTGSDRCRFRSLAIEARRPIPQDWFGTFAFALVRRGFLIRQRMDAQGRLSAIDALGPGGAFPLEAPAPSSQGRFPTAAAYAVTRALICAVDAAPIVGALNGGGETAHDLHALQRETLYRMERMADARARPSARSRVAALLCTLADTLVRGAREPNWIPASFLQRDLADLLSMRQESLCRVLRQFVHERRIERSADGTRLLERAALEAL